MRKVLMAAYLFPPTAWTGVHRTAAFARHLPSLGWGPWVLTTGNCTYAPRDESLVIPLPSELRITRIRSFESEHAKSLARRLARLLRARGDTLAGLDWRVDRLYAPLSIPDRHLPWALAAVPAGLWLMLRHRIDVIYSTSWPYSDHVAGLILHRLTGRPWVADFRDPWLTNANYRRDARSRLGRLEAWIESQFIRHAAAVVVTSESMRDEFVRRYPQSESKFTTVYNGFEPAAVAGLPDAPTQGPMTLGYVGAFYRYNSPRVLFEAVALLARRGVSPEQLQVLCVGDMGGEDALAAQLNVAPYVRCTGRQNAANCYRQASACQVLWLVNDPRQDNVLPSKVYEYMAASREILALVTEGSEAYRILARAGGVTFAPPTDPAAVAAAVEQLLARHRAGPLACRRDEAYVGQFSRANQARRLAAVFEGVLKRRGPS